MFISRFPIITTDQGGTEDHEGISPPFKQTIRTNLSGTEGSDSVVSEYGIRVGIDELLASFLQGENLGVGYGVYKNTTVIPSQNKVYLNLKSINTQTPGTISISTTGNELNISFVGGISYSYSVNTKYVQGGSKQLLGHFRDDFSQSIPLSANMQDTALSGQAGDWTTDIAVGKTSVLFTKPFDNEGVLVWVGTIETEEYGRLLLEEDLITNYSFVLTEEGDGDRILLYDL